MEEIWRDVFDYPEYFMISNKGRVWSKRTNKVLVQTMSKSGYPVISSRIGGRDGKAICKKVHRWIANAFIYNPENKPFVNHIDGDKKNNSIGNLEWCTAKENAIHASENGLLEACKRVGIESTSSKLTEDDVIYIRTVHRPRHKMFGTSILAKEFGVDRHQISDVVKRKSYSNIP